MIRLHRACFSPAGFPILEDFSLDLAPGTITALVGRSGCGKSTLLRVLAGLCPLHSGNLTGVPQRKAFVFQDAALLPWLTARENVALPGHFSPILDPDEALAAVGLGDHSHKLPAALSGGQRMRVSLARALVAQPELVLLDEAFGALDGLTRRSVQRVFLRLAEDHGWTVVMVTHEPEDALLLADRVLAVDGPSLKILADRRINHRHPRDLPEIDLVAAITANLPPPPLRPTLTPQNRLLTHPPMEAPTPPSPPPPPTPPLALKAPRPPWMAAGLAGLSGLGLWALIAYQMGPLMLPSPLSVLLSLVNERSRLWEASLQSLTAAGLGLLMATLLGLGSAVLAWARPVFRLILLPYVTLLQIIPIVAIAPLLVLWLGYGIAVPTVTATIACFFPIWSGASTGLVAPSAEWVELLRLYGADAWGELRYLRSMAALPALFSGLRTAAGLAVIGAIVGEFVGSNGQPASLGFLVSFGARSTRTDLSFAAILCAGLLALGFQRLIQWAEQRLIGRWYGH